MPRVPLPLRRGSTTMRQVAGRVADTLATSPNCDQNQAENLYRALRIYRRANKQRRPPGPPSLGSGDKPSVKVRGAEHGQVLGNALLSPPQCPRARLTPDYHPVTDAVGVFFPRPKAHLLSVCVRQSRLLDGLRRSPSACWLRRPVHDDHRDQDRGGQADCGSVQPAQAFVRRGQLRLRSPRLGT